MIDRDLGEIPLQPSTKEQLSAAVTQLRSEDGFLFDHRLIEIENVPGVQSVCVGESVRGQYIVIANATGNAGPFLRDIYILEETPKLYRAIYTISDAEAETAARAREEYTSWQHMVSGMSESGQYAEHRRYYSDAQRLNDILQTHCDISDSFERGDISEDEMNRRRKAAPITFTIKNSSEPEEVAYETAYASVLRATMNYQMLQMKVNNYFDVMIHELVEAEDQNGAENTEETAPWVPVMEPAGWRLISVLDRAMAATQAA